MEQATKGISLHDTAEIVIAGVFPPQALEPRQYKENMVGGPNAHQYWYRVRNELNGSILGPILIVLNYVVINLAKHCPSLDLKRWLFRRLGMKLGDNVTIASGATLDYFFPELIEIGENSIIGMDSMILTHEFLLDRWRCGKVSIGKGVMVGAQSLILAGVTIGDRATISAKSLVHKSVPGHWFVGGDPLRIIRTLRDERFGSRCTRS